VDYNEREAQFDAEADQEVQTIITKLGPTLRKAMEDCAEGLRRTKGWTPALDFKPAAFAGESARHGSSYHSAYKLRGYRWIVEVQARQIPYPFVPLEVEIEATEKEGQCLLVAHIKLGEQYVPLQVGYTIRDYIRAAANLPGELSTLGWKQSGSTVTLSTKPWSTR
jgi:hypothetical protein